MKIKVGDLVLIITGEFRGTTGKVLKVSSKKSFVCVEGVRPIKIMRKDKDPVSKDRPIHISNVKKLP